MISPWITLNKPDGTPVIINIEHILLFEPQEYRSHRMESSKWGTYILLSTSVDRIVTAQFSDVNEYIMKYQRSKVGVGE